MLTPFFIQHRRLTREMRRELVKSLRTVALLAMFSQDSTTVSNIQSCMKSMSVMEPDLILHPVLERAVPSLEALVEVSDQPVCRWETRLICLPRVDSENYCGDQSPRCGRARNCISPGVLSWCKTSRSDS